MGKRFLIMAVGYEEQCPLELFNCHLNKVKAIVEEAIKKHGRPIYGNGYEIIEFDSDGFVTANHDYSKYEHPKKDEWKWSSCSDAESRYLDTTPVDRWKKLRGE